jgi:CubicO group peptidase (beta-lactamase class C family)
MSKWLFFFLPVLLNAGLFDWFETLSPKAEKAKNALQEFDVLIEKALLDHQVPGIAVGVVVDGHIIFVKGFGYRNLEQKLPMSSGTLFAVGSCTKAFTTFAMGNLVDEGKVGWDQPVIDILPEFRLWDQYATSNLTFRDLLTHRSGMPRHEFMWYNSKMSKSEMLKRIRYLQPSYDIRERYQYGNLMYFTTGLAMERITGSSWEDFIRERILNPLDMRNSNFSVEETQASNNYATPYLEKNDRLKQIPYRSLSLISAAGSLNSNVDDMLKWVKMLLAGGVYNNQPLISPVTLRELHSPQVVIQGAPEAKDAILNAYGIGWTIVSYKGHYYVSHDGVSDGFTSVVGLLPNENVGFVVLANKNMTALPRFISMAIIDRIMEIPNNDWFKDGVESIRKNKETMRESKMNEDRMRKTGTITSHPLEEYVGVYEHPGYGKLYIDLVDGKLEMTYNDLGFALDHWHYDVFSVAREKQDMIISFEGTKFTFRNNSNGDISEVAVPFEPSADDIIFKRQPSEKHSTLTYLRQFVGEYEIYGYPVEIVLMGHSLIAKIPGQPNYELVPSNLNEFSVKSMTSANVRFVMDDLSKVKEILLIYPYGAFSALPKK